MVEPEAMEATEKGVLVRPPVGLTRVPGAEAHPNESAEAGCAGSVAGARVWALRIRLGTRERATLRLLLHVAGTLLLRVVTSVRGDERAGSSIELRAHFIVDGSPLGELLDCSNKLVVGTDVAMLGYDDILCTIVHMQ